MKYLAKNNDWDIVEDYNIDKLLYLLIDRPNKINCWNDFIWKNKKQWHRDYDLPAYVCNNEGSVLWFKNDKKHKEK